MIGERQSIENKMNKVSSTEKHFSAPKEFTD